MAEGLSKIEYLTWRVAELNEKVDALKASLRDSERQRLAKQNYDFSELKDLLNEVKNELKPEQELWDNSDIIRNWNVSARTLADWRAKGLIGFVQAGNKIWYLRESRELFLTMHFNKPKSWEERDGEEG